MTHNFWDNRPYLKNEYVEAHFDKSTGKSPDELTADIRRYFDEHIDMPMPLVLANTLAYLLENVQLELNTYSIFPDKMNCGISYHPFASFSLYGKLAMERIFKSFPEKLYPDVWARRAIADEIGLCSPDLDFLHTAPDWNAVITLGIPGLLARAEKYRQNALETGDLDEEKAIFYDAVILSYRAAVTYMERLARYAEEKDMEWFAKELRSLQVNPPQSFYQALLQTMIFLNIGELGIERYRTYGMIDRLYYPLYRADIDAGQITREDAAEMLRYFFEKTGAALREADQPLGLGGVLPDGSDATNELTYLILEVYSELGCHDPKIHVRCHENMPAALLDRLLELIRNGNSSIALINDEAVYKGYERIGIPREVSRNYLPIGCYEPIIPGKEDARICASWLNLAKPMELVLHGEYTKAHELLGLPRTMPDPPTFKRFLFEYYRVLDASIEFTLNNIIEQRREQYRINPAPFLSGTFARCVEIGKDFYNDAMEYLNTSVKCFAIGTAVDSLLAVKKIVYEDRLMTLPELSQVMKDNWAGHEALRLAVRADRNKWGNHLPEPDALARDIYEFAAKRIVGRDNGLGGVFRLGADSVARSELYGVHMGATPDGRHAKDPTTKNLRPGTGLEREGITAFISSVTSIDGSLFVDAAPLDFFLHPSAVKGQRGLAAMRSMVKTYFDQGGFAIQGNIISAETLRNAQADPDAHRNLQIRVCGWNEYFVNMNKNLQDDFIARAEGIENA